MGMLLYPQCEQEGCSDHAKWFVLNLIRSWVRCLCDTHEALKTEDELSSPIPQPPPAP